MYVMGILLFVDKIEDARTIKKTIDQGDAATWGWIGWCIILIVFFCAYIFLRDLWKQKQKKKSSLREKEKITERYTDVNYQIAITNDWNRKNKKHHIKKKEKQELEKLRNERDELYRKLKQCEEKVREIENDTKKITNKVKDYKERWIIGIIVITLIIIFDFSNMVVAAQELGRTIKGIWESEENSQLEMQGEQQTEVPVSEESGIDTSGAERQYVENEFSRENVEIRNMDYSFILEDAHLNKILDDTVIDIIFLEGYTMDDEGYTQFLADCRQGKTTELLPRIYDGKLGIKGLLNYIAENLEKPFLNSLEEGKRIQAQVEWERLGPRSTKLEEIIDERRHALWLEGSAQFRRNIYMQLANDYQRFGNECSVQGQAGSQIYYYYGMSIYCCYCALRYAMTDENNSDEEILNYIKARYKEIVDNEGKEIPADGVYRANEMYLLMKECGF